MHIYHDLLAYPQVPKYCDHISAASAALSELNFVSLKIAHLTVACMWQRWCHSAEVPRSVIA
jgi:hypothetical protein